MGRQYLGDTRLTKVFVGGLAWETQEAALREHFDECGEILEAVVICDKISGRSKGYGFVTFKEAEAAKKACEDANPVINGRRANCNLASLGAKRGAAVRPSPPCTPAPLPFHHHFPPGMAVGTRGVSPGPPAAQWHYPHPSRSPPPFQLPHYHGGALPFYAAAATPAYGYSPHYMTDLGYAGNYKSSNGGIGIGMGMGYFQGPPFAYPPSAAAAVDGMVPFYPVVYQGMGIPADFFPNPTGGAAIPIVVADPPPSVNPPPAAGKIVQSSMDAAAEQVKGGGGGGS